MLLFVCLLTGLIKGIRFGIGKNHDFDIFKASPTVLAENLKIKADSGFQGIQKIHKNSEIPHKKSKNNPLNEQKKDFNKQLASKRVPIEHCNRSCKIFKICGNRFRGKHQNYQETWLLVTAIVNLKISTTNLKYNDF